MKGIIQTFVYSLIIAYILGNAIGLSIMSYLAEKSNMTIEEFDHRYVRWFMFSPSMKDIDDNINRKKSRPVPEKIYY